MTACLVFYHGRDLCRPYDVPVEFCVELWGHETQRMREVGAGVHVGRAALGASAALREGTGDGEIPVVRLFCESILRSTYTMFSVSVNNDTCRYSIGLLAL